MPCRHAPAWGFAASVGIGSLRSRPIIDEAASNAGFVTLDDSGAAPVPFRHCPGEQPLCCPIDPQPSGCMQLGGSTPGCPTVCDFWCSENWRIESDAVGCATWRYDTRAPRPGEDELCRVRPG